MMGIMSPLTQQVLFIHSHRQMKLNILTPFLILATIVLLTYVPTVNASKWTSIRDKVKKEAKRALNDVKDVAEEVLKKKLESVPEVAQALLNGDVKEAVKGAAQVVLDKHLGGAQGVVQAVVNGDVKGALMEAQAVLCDHAACAQLGK